MIKKAALGTLALVSVGTLVFGRDACSYLRTGASSVAEAVRSEVPIEFEIERAKKMVTELGPEINKSKRVIIEEEVAVERLEKAIGRKRERMEDQQEAITTLSADLKSGDDKLKYGGRIYTVSQVQKDLADRFNRFKVAEETVQREEEMLNAKGQALAAHRETLENMLSARKDLEVEIERLQARLRSVQAAETITTLDIDESHLNRCRNLIADLNKELDVREKMLDAEGNFVGEIPVHSKAEAPLDIAEQVDRYFSGERESPQVANSRN